MKKPLTAFKCSDIKLEVNINISSNTRKGQIFFRHDHLIVEMGKAATGNLTVTVMKELNNKYQMLNR